MIKNLVLLGFSLILSLKNVVVFDFRNLINYKKSPTDRERAKKTVKEQRDKPHIGLMIIILRFWMLLFI